MSLAFASSYLSARVDPPWRLSWHSQDGFNPGTIRNPNSNDREQVTDDKNPKISLTRFLTEGEKNMLKEL